MRRRARRAAARASGLAALALCMVVAPAHATPPGANGRLVVTDQHATHMIWTANPDGSDFRLAQRVPVSPEDWLEGAGVSPDGTRIACSVRVNGRWQLVISRLDGSDAIAVPTPQGQSEAVAWSPDGTRIAYTEGASVTVTPADGGAPPVHLAEGSGPAWSPDGSRIAFSRDGLGGYRLWIMDADGGAQADTGVEGGEPDWSPDGTALVFIRASSTTIWRMQLDGTGVRRLTPFDDRFIHPVWSPDGTRIAFSSTLNGTSYMAWTMNADGSDMRKLTPFEGPTEQVQWAACPALCATAPPPPVCTSGCLRTAQLPQPSERPPGEELFAFGSFTDAAGHAISITADNAVGTFHDDGDGQWSWSATPSSPVGPGTVTVTARSSSGDTATERFEYEASSAAPGIYLNRHDDQGCSVYLDVMTGGGAVLDVDAGDGRPVWRLPGGGGFGLQYAPGTYTVTLHSALGEEAGVTRSFPTSHGPEDCLYASQWPADASGHVGQPITVTGAFAGGAPPILVYADPNPGSLTDHGDGTWSWTYTPAAAAGTQHVVVRGYSPAGEVDESFAFDVAGDTTPPAIDLRVPADGAAYSARATRRQPVVVSYACSDAESGVRTCSGTLPDGATLPTGPRQLGRHTFTVTATDAAGNAATATSTYTVTP